MNPLHPRIVHLWRLTGGIGVAFLIALVAVLDLAIIPRPGSFAPPAGAITLSVAVLGSIAALVWPSLRYRYWRWAVQDDRVVIQKGVLWRTRSLVPRVRIQHVDTRSSPFQRWLGLSSLVIYTAGTRGSDAEIPGLAVERAERLREQLARLQEPDERA